MYKAIISDKEFKNGVLVVGVRFEDGVNDFADSFQTNQSQPESWIEEQIKRRLAHLNALPALHDSIEVGQRIVLEEDEKKTGIILTDREQYQADLIQFEKFVSAIAKGFTTAETEEFKALKQKLTDNFKVEYIDLF